MKIIKTFCLTICLISAVTISAQYPRIPNELQDSANVAAFQKSQAYQPLRAEAMQTVQQEAEQGRPYIPWASRPEDLPQASIPAFPGAEGAGAYTFGGRGGKVLVVTNLNDSGEGSLRWACEQGGARIVVFNVAGIIRLEAPIEISAPYITIAGQSAPGDGVCIAGATVSINTHDVVLRHLRFRRGAMEVTSRDDAVGGNPVGNIMIDHCSASWGLDENISFYRHMYRGRKLPTVNVTIQNTISSEALDTYNHAFGSTIGGENCTFIRNLWACNISRNPSVGMGGDFNLINCVLFNWWNRTMDGGDNSSRWNVLGNYYKPGPMTPADDPVSYRISKPETGRDQSHKEVYGQIFAKGNVVEGNKAVSRDNWNGGIQPAGVAGPDSLLKAIRSDKPFPMQFPMKKVMKAKKAYKFVVKNAGATWPRRDAVDSRVIEFVQTGNPYYVEGEYEQTPYVKRRLAPDSYKQGIIYHPNQVGGYPEYKGVAYKDSDMDGMPDAWEIKYGLNPNDPSDAVKDCNGDGYTNIEKFINGMNPKKKIDWTNPKNNHDTLAKCKAPLYGTE